MHKTLYMFDMHHRSTTAEEKLPNRPSDESLAPTNEEPKDQADDVVLSSDFSDSDITLVADGRLSGSSSVEKCIEDDSTESEDDSNFSTWDGVRAWEISWYARWELLVELVKRDEVLRNASTLAPNLHGPAQPTPMFFFEGEDDDEEDDDEDDDEDYGTIVSTSFRGTRLEAGFDRAQQFFANRNMDVRSGAKMIGI